MNLPILRATHCLFALLVSIALSAAEESDSSVLSAAEKESSRIGNQFNATGVESSSATLNAPPAKNAIVLFDGSNLEAWSSQKAKAWEEASKAT